MSMARRAGACLLLVAAASAERPMVERLRAVGLLSPDGLAASDRAPVQRPPPPSSEAALEGHGLHRDKGDLSFVGELAIPVTAILIGIMTVAAGYRDSGCLVLYFGAQSGFSLYMKAVLSSVEISSELGLHGIPAAFMVTAAQMVVAFFVLCSGMLLLFPTRWRYTPKPLSSRQDVLAVLCFSLTFCLNIGLNNFSLAFLPVSINLVIRSCLPIATLLMQLLLSACQPGDLGFKKVEAPEVFAMLAGVLCAGMATLAKSEAAGQNDRMLFGVALCIGSTIAGALNLGIATILGAKMDLNPLDSTWYMALPATIFLMPPAVALPHPVTWAAYGNLTDWQVFEKVLKLHPHAVLLVLLSGLFAVAYNLLQYTLVQNMSAADTAFAGNFNKAATIMISILLGVETLPGGVWSAVMMIGVLGNIAAFAGYTYFKVQFCKTGSNKGNKESSARRSLH